MSTHSNSSTTDVSSSNEAERPSIFEYLDYRIFLTDFYEWKKHTDPQFSYRSFGKLAGVSASLFKDILNERQNLSLKVAEKYAEAMKLKKLEQSYFNHLVSFNNAKNNADKNEQFERMMAMRRQRKNTILQVSQYDYFAEWYNAVVRELIHHQPVNIPPTKIAEKIRPAITSQKVKKSIELLQSLELIAKKMIDGKEYWVQTSRSISSDFDVRSQALKKYQHSMIQLAQESIERFSGQERNLQAMTLSGSKESYEKIKTLMNQFVNESFNILEADGKEVEKVFAMNLQLFPLADLEEKGEAK